MGHGRRHEQNRRTTNCSLGWSTGFIWGIADDVLTDVCNRGTSRDEMLPMVVTRRLDAVLEHEIEELRDHTLVEVAT